MADRDGDWLPQLSGTNSRACVLTLADPEPMVLDHIPVTDVTQIPQRREQHKALSDKKQDTAVSDVPSTAAGNSKTDIERQWKPSEKVAIAEGLAPDNTRRQLCNLIVVYSDVFRGRGWRITASQQRHRNVQPYHVSPWETRN